MSPPDSPSFDPEFPEPRLRDFEVLSTVDGVRALADPVRLQMVQILTRSPQTGSMLARTLQIPANRAHYHLKRLVEAGLVRDIGGERGHVTEERYFAATARHILVDPGLGGVDDRPTQLLRQSIDTTFLDWRRTQVLAIDWGDLARIAIHRSLRVRPDDQVLIMFAPITLEAAEAMLIEVESLGAIAHLRPWSRNVILRTLDAWTSEELARRPLIPPDLDGRITAVAFLSSSLVQGAPPTPAQQERLPHLLQAVSSWKDAVRLRGLRYLHVGLPHRGEFGAGFLSPEEGIDTYWRCITADLETIRRQGTRVREQIEADPNLVIEGKTDTELRVTLDTASGGVSDGTISDDDLRLGRATASVPAGAYVALPTPGSGDGVFQADFTFALGRHLRDVRVVLRGGRIVEIDGPDGTEALRAKLEREVGDPGLLSAVTIGLNDGGRGPTGRPELDSLLSGSVTLEFGNNELLGGTVRSTFNLGLPAHGLSVRNSLGPIVVRGRLAPTAEGRAPRGTKPPWKR
ncbi:MAG: helix-turn-helix domain-containing protein [Candidatus Eisenbacteria bacterium]|nr:helix-turn-helix domain-containing protein [Candidatus Eisenbacteria bacterium]